MSASGTMPVDVPTGWECPRCRRVYSPQTGQCLPCSPPPVLAVPRPEPRPFPHPFGPGAEVPPLPRPQACAPSREGGMCGCGEDEETPRWHALADLLDAMAEVSATTHRRIGRAWSEALPGVEFRMAGGATTEALVEFRARLREDA